MLTVTHVSVPEIVWLGDTLCHDRALVGGKAANLSRLAATQRIPPGFCLTTGGAAAAWHAGVRSAYGCLAERCEVVALSVAVRSSALDEDGVVASFAGQHETYLNLAGPDAVAGAVERCLASARSERALAYRRQHGLPDRGVRVAVLVQQLVPADVAAVVFSANPVTGDRDELVLTASWGLGESIVGGTVTPDTYRVRKHDLALLDRRIGDKARMTVPMPGGTREVPVPRLLRTQAALDEAQVRELAGLARALEDAEGHPVDIECAYAGGRLYLLQCRPITALDAAAG